MLKKVSDSRSLALIAYEQSKLGGIMSFLLKFFLNYKCINYHLILNWYNGIERNDYEGFEQAQQLASPFLQSFFTSGKKKTLLIVPIYDSFCIGS